MENRVQIKFATYNLHGFNQGRGYLENVFMLYDFILIQEHWLAPFNLHELNKLCPGFTCYSCSAMNDIIGRGILTGRPYGGVAVYVRDVFASKIKIIKNTDRYILMQFGAVVIINVYMPASGTAQQEDVYCSCLASILNDVNELHYDAIIMGGDFNIDPSGDCNVGRALNTFCAEIDVLRVHQSSNNVIPYTFRVLSTGATSNIDFFFVSRTVLKDVNKCEILDSGINLSDHCLVTIDVELTCDRISIDDVIDNDSALREGRCWVI
jgi:exonuclease III